MVNSLINICLKLPLPYRIKGKISKIHRAYIFDKAMKAFIKSSHQPVSSYTNIINELIYGWGNESWSAAEEYIIECLSRASEANGPILECGSGLSTLLIGQIAKNNNNKHWALEHTPEWAGKVNSYLRKYEIESVSLLSAPLKGFGEYEWYATDFQKMPSDFALVICDGPPGNTKGGRIGLMPTMKKKLKPACVVLLDDAERQDELQIAQSWADEYSASYELLGKKKPFIRLVLP